MTWANYDNFVSIRELKDATERLNKEFSHNPRSVDLLVGNVIEHRKKQGIILTVVSSRLRFKWGEEFKEEDA